MNLVSNCCEMPAVETLLSDYTDENHVLHHFGHCSSCGEVAEFAEFEIPTPKCEVCGEPLDCFYEAVVAPMVKGNALVNTKLAETLVYVCKNINCTERGKEIS